MSIFNRRSNQLVTPHHREASLSRGPGVSCGKCGSDIPPDHMDGTRAAPVFEELGLPPSSSHLDGQMASIAVDVVSATLAWKCDVCGA